MKYHLRRYLIFVFFIFSMGACVSVNIPTGSGKPAKDLAYENPQAPFKEIKVHAGDKAWLSGKTGNTISFISDCNGNADPSLKQLEDESLMVLEKLKITKSEELDYNGREARRTLAEGEVDGVPVKTELMVFKKNGCNFTLSYGGVAKTFDTEKSYFEKFIESFKAL